MTLEELRIVENVLEKIPKFIFVKDIRGESKRALEIIEREIKLKTLNPITGEHEGINK